MMKIIIEKIVEDEDFLHVEGVECVCFGIDKKYLKDITPKEGDVVTLHFINGIGTPIRGMDLNGVQLYYLTDEELAQQHEEQCKKDKDKRRRDFTKIEPTLNKMFELLPSLLQQRILMYRHFMHEFRELDEFYELVPMFLGYKMYRLCYSNDVHIFSKKVLEFEVVKYIKTHRFLKKFHPTWNQVDFARAFAGAIYADRTLLGKNTFDVNELKHSRVMFFPNCSAPLSGTFCVPRKKHIVEYMMKKS